jgi:hypothetical protein
LPLCLVGAWSKPQFCGGFFDAVERAGAHFAKHKHLAIDSLAAAAILIRLSLLWLLPIRIPRIHDELIYLRAADTFAPGWPDKSHPPFVRILRHDPGHPATDLHVHAPAGTRAVLEIGQLLGQPGSECC